MRTSATLSMAPSPESSILPHPVVASHGFQRPQSSAQSRAEHTSGAGNNHKIYCKSTHSIFCSSSRLAECFCVSSSFPALPWPVGEPSILQVEEYCIIQSCEPTASDPYLVGFDSLHK